ncbi:S-layer homology domain-containing protein [Chamaesiphon sp. GL140_3_metabinner_50]|uniref:S-layer homology domain-containing protein n=1 Tax=Chamaesiphon sp. GL140_3_metabinner_50 TaxID=2970812 RepID=UPI0025DC6456|nr:S-layer homology domain-containing protein [Chamaesiphon sp. GL140_3_metabinner_50]
MNQNHQEPRPGNIRIDSLAFLLIGSVSTSIVINTGAVFAEPMPVDGGNLLSKLTVSGSLAEAVNATTNPTTLANRPTKKVAQASDIAGNWAEPFIKALVEKDIIKGYPDGTFKPDRPVTRAEFAALLNRAFDLQPVRSPAKFTDVAARYWASAVIQKAYQSGFLAGYPNATFAPDRQINRIESIVALTNGNKFAPSGNLDLNSVYGDAQQVPSYGQNALIAATQKCIAVGVEYDNSKLPGGNFGAQTVATRADVAAYIHQVLVSTGKLTALDKSSPANKYIAACPQGAYATTISDVTPRIAALSNDEAISKLSVVDRLPDLRAINTNIYPVGGLTTPSAFGLSWGNVFIGASYQASTRAALYIDPPNTGQSRKDGAAYLGFGLGDARNFIGLETVATSYSTIFSGFLKNSSLSFKLHKQFGDNFAIAGGYENAVLLSQNLDGGQTGYGVASFVVNPDANVGFFSNTTISVGGGAGRFRSVGDIRNGKNGYGVFGSLGTRLSPNFSLVADWNGQDLNVGLPITVYLSDSATIQLVPSVVDLVNKETGGSRFTINGGLGFRF